VSTWKSILNNVRTSSVLLETLHESPFMLHLFTRVTCLCFKAENVRPGMTHTKIRFWYKRSSSISSVFLTNRRRFREKSPYRHFSVQFEDKLSVLLECDIASCHRPDTSSTPLRKPPNTRNWEIIQTSNLTTNSAWRSKGFWECTHTHYNRTHRPLMNFQINNLQKET